MINVVILAGEISDDPVLRYSQAGLAILNVRVKSWSTRIDRETGEEKTYNEWHRVVVFGQSAERFESLSKGEFISVRGRNQTRKWQDRDGNDRWSTEVVADSIELMAGEESRSDPPATAAASAASPDAPTTDPGKPEPFFDDDIPF